MYLQKYYFFLLHLCLPSVANGIEFQQLVNDLFLYGAGPSFKQVGYLRV